MLSRVRLFDSVRARIAALLLLHTLVMAALLALLFVGIGRPRQTSYRLPDPDEVAEHRWVELADLEAATAAAPWAFSPWVNLQLEAMAAQRA